MIIVFEVGISVGLQQMKPTSSPSESDTDYPAYKRMLDNLKDMTVVPHPAGSKELELGMIIKIVRKATYAYGGIL